MVPQRRRGPSSEQAVVQRRHRQRRHEAARGSVGAAAGQALNAIAAHVRRRQQLRFCTQPRLRQCAALSPSSCHEAADDVPEHSWHSSTRIRALARPLTLSLSLPPVERCGDGGGAYLALEGRLGRGTVRKPLHCHLDAVSDTSEHMGACALTHWSRPAVRDLLQCCVRHFRHRLIWTLRGAHMGAPTVP